MSKAHSTAAKNAATNAVVDLIDGGAGSNGTLVLKAGATTISTHNFSNPAFGDAASGVATANAIADGTAAADGTVDSWEAKDTDGTVVVSGDAGQKYAIAAVTTGAGGKFEIAGDKSAEFSAGDDINVTGSTGNDGNYTLDTVTYNSGTARTELTVIAAQTVANATVDGSLHKGEVGIDNPTVVTGQTVSISSATYKALRQ